MKSVIDGIASVPTATFPTGMKVQLALLAESASSDVSQKTRSPSRAAMLFLKSFDPNGFINRCTPYVFEVIQPVACLEDFQQDLIILKEK